MKEISDDELNAATTLDRNPQSWVTLFGFMLDKRESERMKVAQVWMNKLNGPNNSYVKDIVIKISQKAIDEKKSREIENIHVPRTWNLPGGRVEIGEEPIHAAFRELEEEVQISMKPNNAKKLETILPRDDHLVMKEFIFLCSINTKDPRPVEKLRLEMIDSEWCPIGKLHEKLSKVQAEKIQEAFRD